MKDISQILEEVYESLENTDLQKGIMRTLSNLLPAPQRALNRWPYLAKLAEEVIKIKETVLMNIDYYVDLTLKNVETASKGKGYLAKTRDEAIKIINEIIGDESRLIVKAKSMVTEELRLREHLEERGHLVFETDLGELLLQVAKEKPMHVIAPAIQVFFHQHTFP